jgi:hypothetical protein
MPLWKAFVLHLAISVAVTIPVAALICLVWYRQPYFQVSGASTLLTIFAGVNLVIGPLLTLVVYRTGKKSLRFDLATIGLLQVAAFGYGLSVIADARPVFVVAAIDRFVVVSANQLDDADLLEGGAPDFRTRSWSGPRLVGVALPKGVDTYTLATSALSGKDVEHYPKYFVPYTNVAEKVLARGLALDEIAKKSSANADEVRRLVSERATGVDKLRGLPLQGRAGDQTLVLNAVDAQPIAVLPIDPWLP